MSYGPFEITCWGPASLDAVAPEFSATFKEGRQWVRKGPMPKSCPPFSNRPRKQAGKGGACPRNQFLVKLFTVLCFCVDKAPPFFAPDLRLFYNGVVV